MEKLSLHELKKIAKIRRIRGYRSMSKERLISSISKSEPVNFDDARIKKIKKGLRDRLSKPKKRDQKRSLQNRRQKKKLIEENLLKLEKSLSKLKKYYHYDDIVYR